MTSQNDAETCRNPFCVLRQCRFKHDIGTGNFDDDDSEKIGCSFVIDNNGFGVLKVLGSIDETSDEATNDLLHHADKLTGLLLVIHSSGGFGKYINPMKDAVSKITGRGVPTVSWIDRACSGAYEIAVSCKTVFCNHEGEAGGLGVTVFQCYQGIYPALVVSNSTPRKNPETNRGPESISRISLDKVDLFKIQNEIDSEAEGIIKFVANQRGLSFNKIREARIGSGNVLEADELLREGLIDKISSMDEAKVELIMQAWFGDNLKEKEKDNENADQITEKEEM